MKIDYIVVHCSESPDGRDDRAADIHRWHLEFGWSGIGYHEVICRDGAVERGRPDYWAGSHARGFNGRSLAVCLIGTRTFTERQMKSLEYVVRRWSGMHPAAKVVGHTDLDSGKSCPNFNVQEWWRDITS